MWQKKRVYLDWAAAAPVSKTVQSQIPTDMGVFGNPGSPHEEGRHAREILEEARERVARLAECKSDAVIFTGSATEANALGIQGSVEALHQVGRSYESMHLLYAPGAHASLVHAVEALMQKGVRADTLEYIDGALSLERLQAKLAPDTVLVAVTAVCSETGAITPVRDIRRVLGRVYVNTPAPLLHVDASQLPYAGPFELTRLGADLLVLDAQKVGGVRGIGALIAPRRVSLSPLYSGGGQERALRPGTPSPLLAHGFATALLEAHTHRALFSAQATADRATLLERIKGMPNLLVNEGLAQAPHILNVSLMGHDTDYLVALLDEAGFAVSTRSSCETDEVGSRAVLALYGDEARASSTLRISWGPTTRTRELLSFADALIRSVKFLDSAGIL